MDYSQIITIELGKRGGKPCIRGMRITVSDNRLRMFCLTVLVAEMNLSWKPTSAWFQITKAGELTQMKVNYLGQL